MFLPLLNMEIYYTGRKKWKQNKTQNWKVDGGDGGGGNIDKPIEHKL